MFALNEQSLFFFCFFFIDFFEIADNVLIALQNMNAQNPN